MPETKKVALITGANKGIGFEVARQIAKAGWTVLAAARNQELGTQAAAKLQAEGLDVQFIQVDLDEPAPHSKLRRPSASSLANSTFSLITLPSRVRATVHRARSVPKP